MTAASFVSKFFPLADPVCRQAGIATVGCLAQCALETGWGEHHPGGVWFGIKRWRKNQQATAQPTFEVVNGQRVDVVGGFAKDDADGDGQVSFEEAAAGYCDFIRGNSRYRAALKFSDDWRQYVRAVAAAGYATDPGYLTKLLAIGTTIEREVYEQGLMTA